jgi:ABC-2 type transport system permease protein
MTAFAAAFRLQLTLLRRAPGELQSLVTVPVYTAIFLSMTLHAGRGDLTAYAVLAPALISMWNMALSIAGDIVTYDRYVGHLELLVAVPPPMALVVAARVAAVTSVSLLACAEAWAVARLGFGVPIVVHHPGYTAAALAVTAFAMSGTAGILSAVFVLTRAARTYQNSLNYPLFLISGVFVPLSLMPQWVQALGRLSFLSWSVDLLRDCLAAPPVRDVAPRCLAVLLLGVAAYVVTRMLFRRVLWRVRFSGSLGHA